MTITCSRDTLFPPRIPAKEDDNYIEHVISEGARFHTLWWDSDGAHCSEKDCIINKKPKERGI